MFLSNATACSLCINLLCPDTWPWHVVITPASSYVATSFKLQVRQACTFQNWTSHLLSSVRANFSLCCCSGGDISGWNPQSWEKALTRTVRCKGKHVHFRFQSVKLVPNHIDKITGTGVKGRS
eukprot:1140969-Pelagomonas_calceolata.AAC.1